MEKRGENEEKAASEKLSGQKIPVAQSIFDSWREFDGGKIMILAKTVLENQTPKKNPD